MIERYDAILKLVIFGYVGCGKTSLRKRFMTNVFDANCRGTIGVDFQTKDCEFDGLDLKLMIWDFAGEERFKYMFPQYLKGAMGGILMYDIADYMSFSRIGDWLSLIKEANQRFPIILLGGKLDLEDLRKISRKDAINTAKSMGLNGFIECSSKTGENVVEAFEALTRIMLKNISVPKKKVKIMT
ncbi:MAG: GTP-binding protein [Candidatus Thorarchaeota archaeon]